MKQLYVFLFFINCCLVLSMRAMPQASSGDSLFVQQAAANALQAYKKETAENLHLYNGSEYLREGHGVKGFPFFQSADMLTGDVFYDGCLYTGIRMQYDLIEDELIVSDFSGNTPIRLVKNKIQYFSIDGHRFVHVNAGAGLPANGFYEILYSGRISAYARWQKGVFGAADNTTSYKLYHTWLVEKDGVFTIVEGERSVLSMLHDKRDVLKKYIQSNKLKFKKDPAGFLAGTIGYYDQLNHYAADSMGRVFITKRFVINPRLPAGFFTSSVAADDTTGKLLPPEEEAPEKEKLKASAENKIYEIGPRGGKSSGAYATLAGYIRDSKSGEAIIGASVYVDTPAIGVITDQYGYYSLNLPRGRHLLRVSSAGMKDTKRQLLVYSDGKLVIEMQEYVSSLRTVVVSAEKASNTKSLQMGVSRLTIKAIKQVPVVFGEADILKVVLTLPGVTSVGEAASGFNVRGGSTDQNLILFSDATIYNPSHLFGFFSAFNPEVVKGIELYKSAIPEKYGGRLSSVLDVTGRDGNSKKWSGNIGLGPLTSKLTIEGPIKKETTTLIAGFRTTYSDWLLRALPQDDYRNSKAGFYDANLHISHTINAKNTLYLTGYISNDRFNLRNDTTYKYSNRNANIKWMHHFNNSFYSVLTTGLDRYDYSVSSTENKVNAFKMAFDINQAYFRSDFSYSPGYRHTISFGLNSVYYKLHPGSYNGVDSQSLVTRNILPAEQALESALYLGDQFAVTPKLSIHAGLRYSVYNYLGARDVYNYVPGLPRNVKTIHDTARYNAGQVITTYSAPEIRLALRYAFSDSTSVKLSFNTLQQYIHMLSNTVAVSPTDIWKLSDPNIRPQQGGQLSLGFYKNFRSNTIETSVEVYYKKMAHFLDYKSGASLLLNHHIETDVVNTRGKAYGIELLIKKTAGKINGWLSYTWSRTFLQLDDPIAGQSINHGEYYPASFDKPHVANFIGNYRFSHRYSLSVNVLYSTGRPITLPVAVFSLGGSNSLLYSERNQYRVPDYFRTDVSFTMEGNHKLTQKTHNSWSFGIYNVTARQNAYSVYFTQEGGKIKGYQLSIFGTLIPFVTYNIKF